MRSKSGDPMHCGTAILRSGGTLITQIGNIISRDGTQKMTVGVYNVGGGPQL